MNIHPQVPAPLTHIVCFSGGESSALVAEAVVRRYGRESAVLLNHDINPVVKDADIKRFKAEVVAALGVEITYANYDGVADPNELPDQFDVSLKAKGFKGPGQSTAFCTSRLKTTPFEKFLAAYYPPGTAVIYYGFDDHEQDRIKRRRYVPALLGHIDARETQWRRLLQGILDSADADTGICITTEHNVRAVAEHLGISLE